MNLLTSLHHSLAGKDIAVEGADIITKRLFQRIEDAATAYRPQSEEWENDALQALRLCKNVEKGALSAQAYVLAMIQDHWEDMSIAFRREYDFQYDVLVMRETNLMPSTMDNYTRAAKVFYGEDAKKPLGKVEVSKYDEYKRPVKVDGEVVKEYQDWDPSRYSISKLALVAPLAKQDKMTPRLWNMVADEQITVEALKKEIYKAPEGETDHRDPSLRFTLDGDKIIAHEFGESVEIAELFFDNGDTDLGRTALRRLLLFLNVQIEQDVLSRMIKNARDTQLIRIYNNGGEALIVDGNSQEIQTTLRGPGLDVP